jgi:hypothetical protein
MEVISGIIYLLALLGAFTVIQEISDLVTEKKG